ncbi:MAG: hypothetical protein ACR2O0_00910 [Rhizobiaceae bacterium]
MPDINYLIFKTLTHIPFNFWLWSLPLIAPLLIFFVPVERSTISHIARVLSAIALSYIFMQLAVSTWHRQGFEAYQLCYVESGHRDLGQEAHDECSHHLVDGPPFSPELILLGWVPAAFYVGLWEIIWRIRNRKKIVAIGGAYTGRWFSNMTASFVLLPFVVYGLLVVVARLWPLVIQALEL